MRKPARSRVTTLAATALTTASLALTGCGAANTAATTISTVAASTTPAVTYPASVQTNFLGSCEAGGSSSQCQCVLSYAEARIPLGAFLRGDRAVITNPSTPNPRWLIAGAKACK